VGHSVCNLAGLQAHDDYQNPGRVVLPGKTACVGLHPQLLYLFTPFFAMVSVCYKDSIPPGIMRFGMVGGWVHPNGGWVHHEWWVGMVEWWEDVVVKSRVHAGGNQTLAPLLAVFELRCSRHILHLGATYYIWVLHTTSRVLRTSFGCYILHLGCYVLHLGATYYI